jgi:hypothetical protein
MGKKSREKWIRRVAAASQASMKERTSGFHSFLLWARSIGAVSILLGVLGLMADFFWISVGALYFGLSVMALDIWTLEDWKKVFKTAAVVVIAVIVAVFTWKVVMRPNPLGIWYVSNGGQMTVRIYNESPNDDEYKDLELYLAPDNPIAFVAKTRVEGRRSRLYRRIRSGKS